MRFNLPYGKGSLACELPDARIAAVVRSEGISEGGTDTAENIVLRSMETPIASPRLEELARGAKRVVLIASDHTRPVPSRVIVPPMLEAIRRGSPEAEITILIATGCHRATTAEELAAKFGEEIAARERIVVHDCDSEELVSLGKLPSGGELEIHRLAAEADLLVAEGFIEPHFFAGFSGGRKSVLPGIASRRCVRHNHNAGFIDSACARSGVLDGNPIHADMLFAAKAARLRYVVNVVLNAHGQVVASFAGDTERAHRAGADYVLEKMSCKAPKSDIVITTNNGYPLDQNLYQMVKGMYTAEDCCAEGGVIIAAGECGDGIGGESFHAMFRGGKSPAALLEEFRCIPPEETRIDQWQAQILARIMEKHSVILVSALPEEDVRSFGMIPASTVEEALMAADALLGRPGSISVIPEGISVIIK